MKRVLLAGCVVCAAEVHGRERCIMARKAEDRRAFDVGTQILNKAVRYALRGIGAVVTEGSAEGRIRARVPFNIYSFGEQLDVQITKDGLVSVTSKSIWPLTFLDWGKNKRNVRFFLDGVGDFVELYYGSRAKKG